MSTPLRHRLYLRLVRNRFGWWLVGWRQPDGWRWKVANATNKLPRQCWSDLVSWALRHHEDDPDTPLRDLARRVPVRFQTDGCRSDRDGRGMCYCGKLRTAEADAEIRAAQKAGAR